MRYRNIQQFCQLSQKTRRTLNPSGSNSSTRIQNRVFRFCKCFNNSFRNCRLDAWLRYKWWFFAERIDEKIRREVVHRNIHEHRPRTPTYRKMKCAFDCPRKIVDAINTIHTLAEWTANLKLAAVQKHVDLLVRMLPVVV